MKISLVVFEIANPSNGVRGRVGPSLEQPLHFCSVVFYPGLLLWDPSYATYVQKLELVQKFAAKVVTKR